jgi:hypothetical protein
MNPQLDFFFFLFFLLKYLTLLGRFADAARNVCLVDFPFAPDFVDKSKSITLRLSLPHDKKAKEKKDK